MDLPRILIIGATGTVGRSLMRQLLCLPDIPFIRASTRNLAKADFPHNVEGVQGDLQDASSYSKLFADVDCIFTYCDDSTPWSKFLEAAKSSGVKRIVLLSSMTVEFDPEGQIGTMHRLAEDAIKASSLEFVFLRPRNFSSNCRSFWVPMMAKTGKFWMTYPHAQTAPVSEDDLAAVAAIGIVTNRILNQAVPLCGPISVSQLEQFNAINYLRQRENKTPIELVILPPDEWRKKMQYWRGKDFDAVFVDQLLKWWKQNDGVPEKIQSSERFTNQPSQTFAEWLEINKEAFSF